MIYVEDYHPEDEALLRARQRGEELGTTPIGPAGGAALRFLAAMGNARTVVEIGTGCGVSGIWLLRGMRSDGVLTCVDIEPDNLRIAREAFGAAGFGSGRARMIAGRALDVLPRLTDGAYDLVLADADPREYPDYLEAALRLLRPGGVVIFAGALWADRVPDPIHHDLDTQSVREVNRLVREDERLIPLLLPVGDGLLCAIKRD